MATDLKPALWKKPSSNQNSTSQHILHFIQEDYSDTNIFTTGNSNKANSFLHSQRLKQSLSESRKTFLKWTTCNEETEKEKTLETTNTNMNHDLKSNTNTPHHDQKKAFLGKKISFKTKKVAPMYRRTQHVAELTKQFDGLLSESNSPRKEDSKLAVDKIVVKRQDSVKNSTATLKFRTNVKRPDISVGISVKKQDSAGSEKSRDSSVSRKPSVKTKPAFNFEDKKLVIVKRKPTVNRKPVTFGHSNLLDNKISVRTKIAYLEKPYSVVQKTQEVTPLVRPSDLPLKKHQIVLKKKDLESPPGGTVRRTIEIFEKKSSEIQVIAVPKKPKVSLTALIQNDPVEEIIQHEQNINNMSLDSIEKPEKLEDESHQRKEDIINHSDQNQVSLDKTDSVDEIVQNVNIPAVLPQRRCGSMYETSLTKSLSYQVLKVAKSEEVISKTSEKIAKHETAITPNTSFLWTLNQDKSPQHTNSFADVTESDHAADDWKCLYDFVDPNPRPPTLPENTIPKPDSPKGDQEKIYEELSDLHKDGYEYYGSSTNTNNTKGYEEVLVNTSKPETDDGYEYCATPDGKQENIYETLPLPSSPPPPLLPRRQQQEPLPPRPPSRSSYCTIKINGSNGSENASNCYESIYNPDGSTLASLSLSSHNKADAEGNYESIYGSRMISRIETASNRDSVVSSDQQSNSLYGRSSFLNWDGANGTYSGQATSDLSCSDKSDDWVDVTDNEDNGSSEIIIIRERPKGKKNSGWSKQMREWSKLPKQAGQGSDNDSDHHYETLCDATKEQFVCQEDYDSFASDTESESSFQKVNLTDSGVNIADSQLPDPPNNNQQVYVLTRLAATAGKHMKKLKSNWTVTKSDITKSLSRMTKRKSRTDLDATAATKNDVPTNPTTSSQEILPPLPTAAPPSNVVKPYQNVEFDVNQPVINTALETTTTATTVLPTEMERATKSLSNRKSTGSGFLHKFRRSMSLSAESALELTSNLGSGGGGNTAKPKSTFYLTTQDIDIDEKIETDEDEQQKKSNISEQDESNKDSGTFSISPVLQTTSTRRSSIVRPSSPPPPIPQQDTKTNNATIEKKPSNKRDNKKTTSWYAEVGLFKNSQNSLAMNKRPNTFWYAEVGLYQPHSTSTASTSSAENSGTNVCLNKTIIAEDASSRSEEYYNPNANQSVYGSSKSVLSESSATNSTTRMNAQEGLQEDTNSNTTMQDVLQLRLLDEPLYQFYNAAMLETLFYDGTTDYDSDGYEQVGDKSDYSSSNSSDTASRRSSRPSAMELVSPSFTRTLWCEIPEVIQSAVLSTLSSHQKRLQEAKFEMITSEASYLNSLNVLVNHFMSNLSIGDILDQEEIESLFGKVAEVKSCSEKLLNDLESCWQDNILLHGVCDIIQKHAEENFHVYVTYCENQISLDETLRKLGDKPGFAETLRKLESHAACQSLALYSFLMLPMQRITRWPLLVDAVLKRLSPQDPEHHTCQYTLATLNKIVSQCNEAARQKERENELKKIAAQLEFAKGVPFLEIASEDRWLIRSGPVTHLQQRSDEIKLTFGKKFVKSVLHLYLFNDLLFVTKQKSETIYTVQHYCARSLVELSSTDSLVSFPVKDTQGKHLLFMTLLENQHEKTVEFLLSCASESDKERWIEALTPPKSQDPDETLYECWDCPQVTAIHNYAASQPDELALSRGDVINVLRKMADGWYHGERIRDGQMGWFPANYTVEIANPHVRSRNLKQRYRLLAFSENYLKSKE